MEEIKTDGFYDRENDRKHVFIPPAPTETERGGITAKEKTTESLEVTVDSATGKAYVALDKTLSKTGEAADAATVGEQLKKITEILNSASSMENALSNFFALRRTGKVYTTRIYKYDTSTSPTGVKLNDNEGLVRNRPQIQQSDRMITERSACLCTSLVTSL